MIIVEAGPTGTKSFDAKIMFAAQLSHHGYRVAIDHASLPEALGRHQKYEAAPYVTDITNAKISGVVLIGAEDISAETLARIHRYGLADDIRLSATGYFANPQTRISASAKIAYALGREANVVDLFSLHNYPLLQAPIAPLFGAHNDRVVAALNRPPELFVFLPNEMLEDPQTLALLGAMDHHPGFNLSIVCSGQGVDLIRKSSFSNLGVHGLTELSPSTFAQLADIVAFFGDSVPGERMARLALEVLQTTGLLVDCTVAGAFVSRGAPALRGPAHLSALTNYLEFSVSPNVAEIGRQVRNSDWVTNCAFHRLETALKLERPENVRLQKTARNPRTVFLPTNGNGLGHAKRCTLVAKEMPTKPAAAFLAFPSCVPLINSAGFSALPLVQKSDFHTEPYANDLVNYLRLRTLLRDGDRLVFDGGFVFESVYRAILERRLSAVWIRRGLWQSGQIKNTAFARELAFEKVIVPTEAFEELNARYTFGDNIFQVGPIVEQRPFGATNTASIRKKLAARFDHTCKQLVVTMMGGGVAADRSAQLQTICALLNGRNDCLHLVVVWPGAKISPSLYGWPNTHVVKTHDALSLAQAADFVISAVGYNSFHEILYHNIPSILIPQIAPYMDDQQARALSAYQRGLAAVVNAQEFLLLEREISAFLNDGKGRDIKAAMQSSKLPETGNNQAANLIGERGKA